MLSNKVGKDGDYNEIILNFGNAVFINVFDQNRFSLGINYHAGNDIKLQLGYMNLYAQKNHPGQFDDANIIRFNIYHRIKLYKEADR